MSDKVFTFMAKITTINCRTIFGKSQYRQDQVHKIPPLNGKPAKSLKPIQVCLFVLCRRVVDGYHSIFQVGTTVRLLRNFLSYSTRSFQAVSHPSTILARRCFPLSDEWQLKEQLRVSRRILPLSAPTILNCRDRTNGSSKGK